MILPGTYGCSRGGGFWGWETRRWTQDPHGHAWVLVDHGEIIEAQAGHGVVSVPASKYLDGNGRPKPGVVMNDQEPLSDDFRRRVCVNARRKVGAPYDMRVNVDIAIGLVFGIHHPVLPAGKDGAFNCSQLVTVVYTEEGFAMFPLVDRWQVSPAMLAQRVYGRIWER